MHGRNRHYQQQQPTHQTGFILIWVLVFAMLMALVMLGGLRGSWFQERVQNNAAFQQVTFQAAESALGWWLDHVQQRLLSDGIQGLQQDDWLGKTVVACATRTGLRTGACLGARFHPGDLPVSVELETRFLGSRQALSSSVRPLRYYHFETQVTSYLEQRGQRQFVARHRQRWRWLDQEAHSVVQGR